MPVSAQGQFLCLVTCQLILFFMSILLFHFFQDALETPYLRGMVFLLLLPPLLLPCMMPREEQLSPRRHMLLPGGLVRRHSIQALLLITLFLVAALEGDWTILGFPNLDLLSY